MFRILFLLSLIFGASIVVADSQSLTDTSDVLSGGATFLAKTMWAACIVIGTVLFAVAFAQFQEHRRNPKLVPLANPITYLLLSVFTLSVPFLQKILGWEVAIGENQEQKIVPYVNIDEPVDDYYEDDE